TISGELEEACSCRPACPCWFKSLPSRMTCDGAQIVLITKGHHGKIPLDGLAVAQFVQSPEHKSMFESFGNWNFDYVYIDEKADEQQRAALKDLALHFFPWPPRSASIALSQSHDRSMAPNISPPSASTASARAI